MSLKILKASMATDVEHIKSTVRSYLRQALEEHEGESIPAKQLMIGCSSLYHEFFDMLDWDWFSGVCEEYAKEKGWNYSHDSGNSIGDGFILEDMFFKQELIAMGMKA